MRIGIYLGCNSDNLENIEKQLIAWGKYLDDHELEGFGSVDTPNSIDEYYEYHTMVENNPTNPISKIHTAFRQTREYIYTRGPDVVIQIWCYPTHGPGVSMAAKSANTTSVVRFSGDHFSEFKAFSGINRGLAYCLHNLCGVIPLRVADGVITLGPYGKAEVVSRGANTNHVQILPPATGLESRFVPPDDKTHIRRKLDLPMNNQIILYVGRISTRKGIPFLLKAVDEFSDSSNKTLVLVGKGEYKSKIRNSYSREVIRVPGYVPYQDIHQYYQSADVYAHPSKYEGIPLTILEALNCEIPIVARDAGDIGYVINDIVDSPAEMATMITNRQYEFVWKNEDKFSDQFQRDTLREFLTEELTELNQR